MEEVIEQLSALAMEAGLDEDINLAELNVDKQELYKHMASNVFQQMNNVSENERAVVAMATMTKLLVENFIYKMKLGK